MPLPRPIATEYDPHRCTAKARFDDGTVGEYYLRGGIAWPTLVPQKDGRSTMQGYAVLCGVNVATDRVVVWAWRAFNAITGVVTGTTIDTLPLGPWLVHQWATWYAQGYYWHDKGETHHQFRRQIHRDDAIIPKPRLSFVMWDDDQAAESVFWLAANERRLGVEEAFYRDVTGTPAGEYCPARHALVCALMGLHRRPWADPGPKPFVLEEEWI